MKITQRIVLFLALIIVMYVGTGKAEAVTCGSGTSSVSITLIDNATGNKISSSECYTNVTGCVNGENGASGVVVVSSHCENYNVHFSYINNDVNRYTSAYNSGSVIDGRLVVSMSGSSYAGYTFYLKNATATYSIEHYKQKADGSGYEKEAGMTGSGVC